MRTNKEQIWFPAKKYGWGWGLPCTWQGWVVYAAWFLLLFCGAILLAPRSIALYVAYTIILGLALIVVVAIKGERPRWRWGKD